MPYEKLYARVSCLVCDGSRFAKSHQNPIKAVWNRCAYCDGEGKTHVSVGVRGLKEHIEFLDEEDLEELKRHINEREAR